MDETGSELATLLRTMIHVDEQGLGNIWPLFYDSQVFSRVVAALASPLSGHVTKVAGVESRGFILGAAVASHLNVGFVAIRKNEGLYPGPTFDAQASSDYRGHEHIFRLQTAAMGHGDVIGLVDDWFETGSQALIAKTLIERSEATYFASSIIVNQLPQVMRDALKPCFSIVESSQLEPVEGVEWTPSEQPPQVIASVADDARPLVICISASSRLKQLVEEVALFEEQTGHIVLAPRFGSGEQPSVAACRLHERKIDLADQLLVIAPNGIGKHVASEIAYAESKGKAIRYHGKEDKD